MATLDHDDDTGVALFGSWGRLELTDHSDDDWLILVDGDVRDRVVPTDESVGALLGLGARLCLAAYDRWVGMLGDIRVREELRGIDRLDAAASTVFIAVSHLADDIQQGLSALLFDTELAPAVREYGIF